MPKVGAEPLRKAALIDATISAVGRAGTLDVTVGSARTGFQHLTVAVP